MGRLSPDIYTSPWGEAELCPCGSGQRFGRCCYTGPRRLPFVSVPTIKPPAPETGYGHAACYLRHSFDCSPKITREHYISESILRQFEQLSLTGLPWQKDDEPVRLGTNALASKILCDRHNSALSTLDDSASHAFRAFVDAVAYATNRPTPGRAASYLVSGDALELWMVKTFAGLHYGGIASQDGRPLVGYQSVDEEALLKALVGGRLAPGAGLYFAQTVGTELTQAIKVAPLSYIDRDVTAGFSMTFGTVRFEMYLTPPNDQAVRQMQQERRYRPGLIDFNGPARDARIILSWKGQGLETSRWGVQVSK